MTRILLVEDEENYRVPLAFSLRRDGFDVVQAADGVEAVEAFEAAGPSGGGSIDLVLLDLMLPRLSGIEVCRRIRRASTVPVIMLTARDSEADTVVGLRIGADDYVTKPYSYRELLARVNAVLRRSRGEEQEPAEPVLEVGRVRMDVERHEVTVDGEAVAMPPREFELLELFMRNPGRVLARGEIIDRVWGADYVGDTKTLDVHVKRIRAKIEVEPGEPKLLITVRGVGYKLAAGT
ncbi:MAG: winged helix-turn-helix domain-containing protein [Actinomyces dentalis]